MKNTIKLSAMVLLVNLGLSACNGDHSARSNGDTVNYANRHDNPASDSAKLDTSKVTTHTGDAGTLDNSGSGGTKIAKDSGKVKKP